MREIKFRAWDKKHKEMLLGNSPSLWLSFYGKVVQGFDEYGESDDWSNKVILMQFTGLKDKNGKEIYGGDITKHEYLDKQYLEEVTWSNNRMGWVGIDNSYINSYEVIGNIYENPELLKEKV